MLGISNISFGLPAAAREVVNSVFLYYCTKAGLDLAIVNAEKLERFASIPPEERRLAESLLFNTPPVDADEIESLRTAPEDWREQSREQKTGINQFHIAAIAEHFRKAGKKDEADGRRSAARRAPGQLHHRRHQGRPDPRSRPQARRRRRAARHHQRPADGRHGRSRPPVQQQRADRGRGAAIGRGDEGRRQPSRAVHGEGRHRRARQGVLATVKGDVHDIGKNLVEIILANNGYQVINLGIKVPPDDADPGLPGASSGRHRALRPAGEERAADGDHRQRSEDRGHRRAAAGGRRGAFGKVHAHAIAPAYGEAVFYAKDAMTGLSLMNQFMDPAERAAGPGGAHVHRSGAERRRSVQAPRARQATAAQRARCAPISRFPPRRISTARCATCRTWPRSGATSIRSCCTAAISATRAISKSRWPSATPKALELYHKVEEVKHDAAQFMKVRAVWQFFEAERDGNAIHLFAPGAASARPHVPLRPAAPRRRPVPERLHPRSRGRPPRPPGAVRRHRGRRHPRAIGRVQAGRRVLQGARAAGAGHRNRRRLRRVAAPPHPRRLGLPRSAHHSPCRSASLRTIAASATASAIRRVPNLDDQQGIWKLLRPEEIGVQLTEGLMMEPEASVSALVFHHPDCAYFTADEAETAS